MKHLRCKEEWSSSDTVDQQGTADGHDKSEHLVTGIETKLVGGAGDSSRAVNDVGVIGDQRVSRPLRDQAEGDNDHKTVSISLRLEEVHVRGSLLVGEFQSNGLPDFGVLELHQWIVLVAIGMVLRKHMEGLLILLLRK